MRINLINLRKQQNGPEALLKLRYRSMDIQTGSFTDSIIAIYSKDLKLY